jgi:pheromone shutdown protein TraB
MILLIGTGHVFDLSQALLDILENKNPDVVCVELDKQRYEALKLRDADPEKFKKTRKDLPIAYKLLARFQENMAQKYGVEAGDEMLTAIEYAESHQIPLKFIDLNAPYMFTKMLRSMTLIEKLKLFLTSFLGIFVSKKQVEVELERFEKDFDTYIKQIEVKFPTIKKVLIDERNNHMAQQLENLSQGFQNIIACVGDGHIPGLAALLESKELKYDTIRLRELRKKGTGESEPGSAHFSIEYKNTI